MFGITSIMNLKQFLILAFTKNTYFNSFYYGLKNKIN